MYHYLVECVQCNVIRLLHSRYKQYSVDTNVSHSESIFMWLHEMLAICVHKDTVFTDEKVHVVQVSFQ